VAVTSISHGSRDRAAICKWSEERFKAIHGRRYSTRTTAGSQI